MLALVWALCPEAVADTGGSTAAQKQTQDSSGSWDVPPGWNPATAPTTSKATPTSLSPDAVLASDSIVKNQVAQIKYYYCGPAAVKEALGVQGVGSTQDGLADSLGTTTDGTAWYLGNNDYPVPNVLNARLPGTFTYVPVNVDYTPTSSQVSNFEGHVVADIYDGYAPIGNAWEVAGGPHLVGHPKDKTIYHYFEIRGYDNSGGDTKYEDSVYDATSVSWYADVTSAYSTMSSSTIATILGGRGYVW